MARVRGERLRVELRRGLAYEREQVEVFLNARGDGCGAVGGQFGLEEVDIGFIAAPLGWRATVR